MDEKISLALKQCMGMTQSDRNIGYGNLEQLAKEKPEAAYLLARLLHKDPQMQKAAFSYMKRAAEEFYEPALVDFGAYYQAGIGTIPNIREAVKWYEKADELYGNPVAQYSIGCIWYLGIQVEKDLGKAVAYFRKAASNEYADACVRLGNMYCQGEYVGRDYFQGSYWFEKGYQYGNKNVCQPLGNLYFPDNQMIPDEELALEWYYKGMTQGCRSCTYMLAYCYESGIGTEVNPEYAFLYYRKAADMGLPEGCLDAAVAIMEGRGTAKNDLLAERYLQKASACGIAEIQQEALRYLARLKRRKTGIVNRYESQQAGIDTNLINSGYTGLVEEREKQAREEAAKRSWQQEQMRIAASRSGSRINYMDISTGAVFNERMEIDQYVDFNTGTIFGRDGSIAFYDQNSHVLYDTSDGSMSYCDKIGDSIYNLKKRKITAGTESIAVDYSF